MASRARRTEQFGTRAVERRRVTVHGIVQGVGFRPFINRLATRYRLSGSVFNFTGGVTIEIEGAEKPAVVARSLQRFYA